LKKIVRRDDFSHTGKSVHGYQEQKENLLLEMSEELRLTAIGELL
jgi:hypothetical protein